MRKLTDKIKKHFRDVWEIKTSSHSIALGFAIGTLIAVLPTPGFGVLLGLFLVLIFKRINKFSLIVAFVFWNPFVLLPFYYLSYKIGNILFGSLPVIKYDVVILDQIYNFSRRFLVGNLLIAIFLSITSYFLIRFIVKVFRKKHG